MGYISINEKYNDDEAICTMMFFLRKILTSLYFCKVAKVHNQYIGNLLLKIRISNKIINQNHNTRNIILIR